MSSHVPGDRKPVETEDPAFYEALGIAIKVARTQQDLSRKDLAERTSLSYAYLADIETGRGRPSSKTLLAIAQALGRTPSELLQEAELYGSVSFAAADSLPAVGAEPSGERRWFHGDVPSASPRSHLASMSDVAMESHRRASSRLAKRTATAKAELHTIVDELSDEDAEIVLEVARRLLPPGD